MILLAVIMSTTIRERMPNPQDTFARPFEYSGNTAPGFGELGDVKAKLTDSVDGNRTTETFIEIQFGFTTSKYQRPPYATLVDGKTATSTRCALPSAVLCKPEFQSRAQ